MAKFEAKAFNANSINNGNKYVNGDGISADAINAPIEAAMLMQSLALNQPDTTYAGLVGEPSVSIVYEDGNPKFSFSHLKGAHGTDHTEDIQRIDAVLNSNKTAIDKNSDAISYLEKKTQNIEEAFSDSVFITEDRIAYIKNVPENIAQYAMLKVLGGYTTKSANKLIHSKPKGISSNGTMVFSVPQLVMDYEGYGLGIDNNFSNKIVYNDNSVAWHAECAIARLNKTTLNPSRIYTTSRGNDHTVFVMNIYPHSQVDYKSVLNLDIPYEHRYDGNYPHYYTDDDIIVFILPNSVASDAEGFVNFAEQNQIECVYALKDKEIKDITDLMPKDHLFRVVSGGTYYFVNDSNTPVVSSVVYQKGGFIE